ncbi:glycine-rich domain-containing protein [Streptomyces chryseus]
MSITSTATQVRDARSYLTPAEFTGVTTTVQKDNPGMADGVADRITLEAIKFVAVAAQGVKGIAPSRVVDQGWHALILHTALYARLCDRIGGGFVHHYPELPDSGRYDPEFIDRTMNAISAAGFSVDRDLWFAPDAGLIEVQASCQHSPNCGPIEPGPKPQCLPEAS